MSAALDTPSTARRRRSGRARRSAARLAALLAGEPPLQLPPLIGVDTLAGLIGVSARTVWRWADGGKLPPPVRLSRTNVRWKRGDILRWLDGLKAPARQEAEFLRLSAKLLPKGYTEDEVAEILEAMREGVK